MDNYFYIIRQNDYNDESEHSDISLQDWLIYVNSDRELKLDYAFQARTIDSETTMEHVTGFCNWTSHPDYVKGTHPHFICEHGCITSKNPDDYTIIKMIEIADILNGRVINNEQVHINSDNFPNNNLRNDFGYDKDNLFFGELTADIDIYKLFTTKGTFVLDTRGMDLNLYNISAASFKLRLYLKDYKESPTLYSLGRTHRIKKGNHSFEFTVKDLATADFIVGEMEF
jgi:hypothetical protein